MQNEVAESLSTSMYMCTLLSKLTDLHLIEHSFIKLLGGCHSVGLTDGIGIGSCPVTVRS